MNTTGHMMAANFWLNSPFSLFAAGEKGLWLDPSDITTLFQDSAGTTPVTALGDPVGLIKDKSGRGNHASQSTSSKRPTWQYDSAHGYYLSFDGVDDYLSTASLDFTGTDKISVFAGAAKVDDTARIICELSANFNGNNGSFYFALDSTSGNGWYSPARGTAGAVYAQAARAITYSGADSAVLTITHSISANLSTIRRNGAAGTNGTGSKGSGNFGNYPLYIGARAGTSLFFNSRLYQLVVRGSMSSTDEITRNERFINMKMNAY